ncbi:MAG: zf-HC2 domain-containing protein [Candidatus Omnitrophota bacterium]
MNRICPSEETMSRYLSGTMLPEDRALFEKHLVSCAECRKLIIEAYEIVKSPDPAEIKNRVLVWARQNAWLLAAIFSLSASFIIQKYFFQFLTASFILGVKWIIDSKAARILIMIREASKHDPSEAVKSSRTTSKRDPH